MIRQNLPTFFSFTRLVTRLRTEKQVGNINIPFKILRAEKDDLWIAQTLGFCYEEE